MNSSLVATLDGADSLDLLPVSHVAWWFGLEAIICRLLVIMVFAFELKAGFNPLKQFRPTGPVQKLISFLVIACPFYTIAQTLFSFVSNDACGVADAAIYTWIQSSLRGLILLTKAQSVLPERNFKVEFAACVALPLVSTVTLFLLGWLGPVDGSESIGFFFLNETAFGVSYGIPAFV